MLLLENNALKFDSFCKKRYEANMMYLKASIINLEIMAALIANLLQTCPIFLNAATHTNDREAVDKQAWSLRSAPFMSVFLCERRCEKLCILDDGTQDIALSTAHSFNSSTCVMQHNHEAHTNALVTFWHVPQNEEVETAISEALQMPEPDFYRDRIFLNLCQNGTNATMCSGHYPEKQ
jgi:hypothetical protein